MTEKYGECQKLKETEEKDDSNHGSERVKEWQGDFLLQNGKGREKARIHPGAKVAVFKALHDQLIAYCTYKTYWGSDYGENNNTIRYVSHC